MVGSGAVSLGAVVDDVGSIVALGRGVHAIVAQASADTRGHQRDIGRCYRG
jgi:hypothetical protein